MSFLKGVVPCDLVYSLFPETRPPPREDGSSASSKWPESAVYWPFGSPKPVDRTGRCLSGFPKPIVPRGLLAVCFLKTRGSQGTVPFGLPETHRPARSTGHFVPQNPWFLGDGHSSEARKGPERGSHEVRRSRVRMAAGDHVFWAFASSPARGARALQGARRGCVPQASATRVASSGITGRDGAVRVSCCSTGVRAIAPCLGALGGIPASLHPSFQRSFRDSASHAKRPFPPRASLQLMRDWVHYRKAS